MASLARVLVVDDEPTVAGAVRDALVEFGYAVKVAFDGREALAIVPAFEPDVVLLDISMPQMSGFEVLDHLRRDHADVSVVMLTGNQDAAAARSTLARGAFDYVAKPFTLERLETVVGAALVRRAYRRRRPRGGPEGDQHDRDRDAPPVAPVRLCPRNRQAHP